MRAAGHAMGDQQRALVPTRPSVHPEPEMVREKSSSAQVREELGGKGKAQPKRYAKGKEGWQVMAGYRTKHECYVQGKAQGTGNRSHRHNMVGKACREGVRMPPAQHMSQHLNQTILQHGMACIHVPCQLNIFTIIHNDADSKSTILMHRERCVEETACPKVPLTTNQPNKLPHHRTETPGMGKGVGVAKGAVVGVGAVCVAVCGVGVGVGSGGGQWGWGRG